MDPFVRAVLEFIRVIVIVAWAVLGLFFWIPFLVRMTAIFISSVVVSAFADSDISSAELGLSHATKFYVYGFQRINRGIANIHSDERENYGDVLDPAQKKRLIVNLIFTLVFWLVTVLAVLSFTSDWQSMANELGQTFDQAKDTDK